MKEGRGANQCKLKTPAAKLNRFAAEFSLIDQKGGNRRKLKNPAPDVKYKNLHRLGRRARHGLTVLLAQAKSPQPGTNRHDCE